MGIPEERIFRFGRKDNFWEHGSGPCGPCSEIYYDRGPEFGCGEPGCTVGCDCDRYIEVWNLVFTQFNSDGGGNYTELAQKNIDTGMGLERLAVVCQGVNSLFDVDTVMNITGKVSEITGVHYGESFDKDVSLRIITDHIRSATFMASDGVLPSNEGRGYVLRRLLRRAARHGRLLGVKEPFLYKVCATVISENCTAYHDLQGKREYITRTIRAEEENFAKTIDAGIDIFSGMLSGHKAKGQKVFSGADAFKLYDTYGFPIDLTAEMAADEGLEVDRQGFDALMLEQRERARAARAAAGETAWAGIDLGLDSTPTEFIGYTKMSGKGKILAMVSENELRDNIGTGVEAIIVLNRTPFYAEMGGQVADRGILEHDGAFFEVTSVQKNKAGKYLHYGKVKSGEFQTGEAITAEIDIRRRRAVMRAHSCTHLLQKALRAVLGDHVHQAGSLVEPDLLRFDFTHFSAMTPAEISEVERIVNDSILEGYPVCIEEMSIAKARDSGATALFGEKYGDTVRVVTMGDGYSRELCGGTHLDNTAKVGSFRITAEFSVASGVRRIEAITGLENLRDMEQNRRLISAMAEKLKTKPAEIVQRMDDQNAELRGMRQTLEKFKSRELLEDASELLSFARDVGGLKVLTIKLPDIDTDGMRKLGDFIRDRADNAAAVFATVKDDKITFLAVCAPKAVAAGISAGDIIRHVAAICGGRGGGKPDSAMGGGTDICKLDEALNSVDGFVLQNRRGRDTEPPRL